jgi:hypothetical protein
MHRNDSMELQALDNGNLDEFPISTSKNLDGGFGTVVVQTGVAVHTSKAMELGVSFLPDIYLLV